MDPEKIRHLVQFYVRAEAMHDFELGKLVEVRLWSHGFDRVKPGNIIAINCPSVCVITRRVVRKTRYQGIQALMDGEKLSGIFPDVMDERTFVVRAGRYYDVEKLKKELILAFELSSAC